MKDPRPQPIHRKNYRPPDFLVDAVRLRFELDEQVTRVHAELDVRRSATAGPEAPLVLHGEHLRLRQLAVDGRALDQSRYRVDGGTLTVPDVPDRFVLATSVEIEPHANTELQGLYRSGSALCTQCEAEGYRRITYFLDRPDVMARYSTTLVADPARYPVLLSNGNRTESGTLEDGRHWVRWEDPFPKPSYLFALVAADLRCHAGTFTTRSGRDVKLEIWVEPHNLDACDHALRSLQRAMKWDEETFGLEYDLDVYMVVAVSDFNMAAMENKGLNIFNAKYVLARPETATDDDYEDIEGVIAHEYFHNWTGNRVTCRDWFQLTLKEGLTVFRDEQFTADTTSRAVKRIQDVTVLRTAQFAEDQSPTAHPIRPESYIEMNNFYTVTVYNKGAEVVRMMHTILGAPGFRRGMDLYFARHDGQAVTCDDFRAAMADGSGVDLEQFGRWYSQAGTPTVVAEPRYDAAARTFALTLRQEPPQNAEPASWQPLHVPVAIGLLGGDGRDLPLVVRDADVAVRGTTALLELREPTRTWTFEQVAARPVVSLLRDFSAPVKLQIERSDAELAFLMAHDADPVSRWDAAQQLGDAMIGRAVGEPAVPRVLDDDFVGAFGGILRDPALDGSIKALMLTLPDERVVGQRMEVVDVDGIHRTRRRAIVELATRHADALRATYDANRPAGGYSIARTAIDGRRIANLALRYLVLGGIDGGVELALAQFRGADNMSDAQAALACLVDVEGDVREAPLAEFHARWRHDPLVLDKWFALQSVSSREDTISRVLELVRHPDFGRGNPNRVRAVLGSFSVRNQVRFHGADGRGYALLADEILAIDAQNPQLAARLVTAFAQWQRFDEGRREHMRSQLARIVAHPKLSRDVYELASKNLGLPA